MELLQVNAQIWKLQTKTPFPVRYEFTTSVAFKALDIWPMPTQCMLPSIQTSTYK